MSYATEEDYKQYGKGIIPSHELDKALARASDQIDTITYNRIVQRGFENLTPFQQENVKKAVCIQADFNHEYGEYLSVPMGSFSAGSISWSFDQGINRQISTEVINLLLPTGLANRGIRG